MTKYAEPLPAAEAAVQALLKQYPDEAAHCGLGGMEMVAQTRMGLRKAHDARSVKSRPANEEIVQ